MMKKALKIIFFAGVAVIVALFFLSLFGIVENNHGNSFGFPYKTAYTSFLLTMALIYAGITDGKVGKIGLAVYVCLTGFVLWLGGKTDFVLLLLLTLVLFLIHFEKTGSSKLKASVSSFMRFSFIIVCAVNFLLVFSYRMLPGLWRAVPGIQTFKDRLLYGVLAFEEYPLSLFGSFVAIKGSYGETASSLYFVLDSAYVKCILEAGVIPFILALTVLTGFQFWLFRRRFYIQMFALSLFAVDLAMNGIELYLLLLITFIAAYCFTNVNKASSPGRRFDWIVPSGVTALLVIIVVICYAVSVLPARRVPDAITVDLRITDYDQYSLEQLYNGLYSWEEDHPGITVAERERIMDYDVASLAVMGTEHMPDVFVTDCLTGRLMADAGMVTDLTGIAEDSGSFTYNGTVYAFPALRESYSVIVYDPESWSEGGEVGFLYSYIYSFINSYMSSELSDDWGRSWEAHMAAADGQASFTDPEFILRLSGALDRMSADTAFDSYSELEEAFVSGECPAVAISGEYLYMLLDDVRASDPDLYNRLEFSSLTGEVLPRGYEFGIYVRAGMDEQKTAECIELASYLADSVPVNNDITMNRLYDLASGSRETALLSNMFTFNFWYYSLGECYYNRDRGNLDAEQMAQVFQEYYGLYYVDYQ